MDTVSPEDNQGTMRERELEVEVARLNAELAVLKGEGEATEVAARFLTMAAATVDQAMADARREADELATEVTAEAEARRDEATRVAEEVEAQTEALRAEAEEHQAATDAARDEAQRMKAAATDHINAERARVADEVERLAEVRSALESERSSLETYHEELQRRVQELAESMVSFMTTEPPLAAITAIDELAAPAIAPAAEAVEAAYAYADEPVETSATHLTPVPSTDDESSMEDTAAALEVDDADETAAVDAEFVAADEASSDDPAPESEDTESADAETEAVAFEVVAEDTESAELDAPAEVVAEDAESAEFEVVAEDAESTEPWTEQTDATAAFEMAETVEQPAEESAADFEFIDATPFAQDADADVEPEATEPSPTDTPFADDGATLAVEESSPWIDSVAEAFTPSTDDHADDETPESADADAVVTSIFSRTEPVEPATDDEPTATDTGLFASAEDAPAATPVEPSDFYDAPAAPAAPAPGFTDMMAGPDDTAESEFGGVPVVDTPEEAAPTRKKGGLFSRVRNQEAEVAEPVMAEAPAAEGGLFGSHASRLIEQTSPEKLASALAEDSEEDARFRSFLDGDGENDPSRDWLLRPEES